MTRFTVPGADREFDAIELRRADDGTHPIVDAATAHQVAAAMGRRMRWFGKNLAIAAPGVTGEVIEVLRPDSRGRYDLASINWLGERPSDEASPAAASSPRRRPRAAERAQA